MTSLVLTLALLAQNSNPIPTPVHPAPPPPVIPTTAPIIAPPNNSLVNIIGADTVKPGNLVKLAVKFNQTADQTVTYRWRVTPAIADDNFIENASGIVFGSGVTETKFEVELVAAVLTVKRDAAGRLTDAQQHLVVINKTVTIKN